MKTLESRLKQIKAQIKHAAEEHERSADSVQLLAVSKKQPADQLRAAYALGQSAFGENYLQEARDKQEQLADLDIEWHFIGPIQSNKTRELAEHFQWVHSIDRLKVAKRLNDQRPEQLPQLNVCLQINIDNEPSKSGISLEALPALAEEVAQLPRLRLRGLMAIPKAEENPLRQRETFGKLTQAMRNYPEMDTLSMGMSADMNAAIAAGSTLVRIGTAIFGKRSV